MQSLLAKKLRIRLRCLLRMNSSGLADALEGEKCVLSELAQISELRSWTNFLTTCYSIFAPRNIAVASFVLGYLVAWQGAETLQHFGQGWTTSWLVVAPHALLTRVRCWASDGWPVSEGKFGLPFGLHEMDSWEQLVFFLDIISNEKTEMQNPWDSSTSKSWGWIWIGIPRSFLLVDCVASSMACLLVNSKLCEKHKCSLYWINSVRKQHFGPCLGQVDCAKAFRVSIHL